MTLQAIADNQQKLAYSVEDAAEQTSLSKPFLRLEIKRGKIKVRRIGRRVLILHEDLKAYLKKDEEK